MYVPTILSSPSIYSVRSRTWFHYCLPNLNVVFFVLFWTCWNVMSISWNSTCMLIWVTVDNCLFSPSNKRAQGLQNCGTARLSTSNLAVRDELSSWEAVMLPAFSLVLVSFQLRGMPINSCLPRECIIPCWLPTKSAPHFAGSPMFSLIWECCVKIICWMFKFFPIVSYSSPCCIHRLDHQVALPIFYHWISNCRSMSKLLQTPLTLGVRVQN